jgi:PleD family two-component response regulator
VNQTGVSAEETLRRADRALYAAKRAGGDRTARSDRALPPRRIPADGTARA